MYQKAKMPSIFLGIPLCLGFFFLFKAVFVFRGEIGTFFFEQFQMSILDSQVPAISYVGETEKSMDFDKLGKNLILKAIPVYGYAKGYPQTAMESQDQELMHQLILSEGRDEVHAGDAGSNNTQNNGTNEETATDAFAQENTAQENAVQAGMNSSETENSPVTGTPSQTAPTDPNISSQTPQPENIDMANAQPLANLTDFETLKSKYYVMDSTTSIDASQLNVGTLLGYDMKLKTPKEQPQILIYHTHSQEGFVDSDFSDPSTTIVGAGELLAQYLRSYGFNVIHDTGKYDVADRDYAYSCAAPAIEEILKENPSIEVVIDLHRDGVAESTHMVTECNGKTMAQFMFFNGLSRTVARGDIEYLKNENIGENLAFSFQAQRVANAYYPGLARKIYLKGYRYNMHYRGKSLLIELGAQTNTVEEIMNAVEPIANILKLTLEGKGAE